MITTHIEDLAFAYWQYKINEKAYTANIITHTMYEFAKEELIKTIDLLEKLCCNVNNKVGESNGFIANTTTIK